MQGPTFSILSLTKGVNAMHNEFTAIVERDDNWFIAYCPEIPGANEQGRTKDECLRDLSQATEISDRLTLKICSNLSIPAAK
jgi:predicted RNase H-like HicB family nuclease